MEFIMDSTVVYVSIATIVLAILGSIVSPFFRKLRMPEDSVGEREDETATPAISVLLPVHEGQMSLESAMTCFLEQDYPNYQVIAVAEKGDNNVEDILKRLQAQFPHLYYTMIPNGSRYMSREKLLVTIGVKAAAHEWIVLSQPTCIPRRDWLRGMSTHLTEDNRLVMGIVLPSEENSGYVRFRHIRTLYYLVRRAQRRGALRSHMANIAFRKSDFIEEKGYQGNLHLVRGELDFLVNKYAKDGQTDVALEPCTWLMEEEQTRKTLINRRLYLMASQKYLKGMTSMRMLCFMDRLLPYAGLLTSIGSLAYGLLTHNLIPIIAAAAGILTLLVARMLIAAKAVHAFDNGVHTLLMPLYELRLLWTDIADKIRYMRSDKIDFTSHKQ